MYTRRKKQYNRHICPEKINANSISVSSAFSVLRNQKNLTAEAQKKEGLRRYTAIPRISTRQVQINFLHRLLKRAVILRDGYFCRRCKTPTCSLAPCRLRS